MSNSERRKKLIYRSSHRGCKETDILLGDFAKSELPKMSEGELDLYQQFIEEDDWDIYAWLTGNLEPPEYYRENIITAIKEFKRNV